MALRLRVVVEAAAPLLIGEGLPTQNVQTSRKYIPGSVWRGGVADAILTALGAKLHWSPRSQVVPMPPDRDFAAALLQGARFGFLFPAQPEADGDAFPIPLTARTCKAHSGFPEDNGHGVFDLALGRLRVAAGGAPSPKGGQCPVCGDRVERLRGFASATHEGEDTYREVKPPLQDFVRVGLNRGTETAEEQMLYVLEAMGGSPQQPLRFVGAWYGEEAHWQALERLLHRHLPKEGESWVIRLGTARARGFGRATISFSRDAARVFSQSLPERLDAFQPRKDGSLLDPDRVYATLTLRSPMVIRDWLGLPAPVPGPLLLRPYAEAVPPDLEPLPEASAVEWETWSGWSMAWGLPKRHSAALAPGSVLAFRCPVRQRDALIRFITLAETEGLGERRTEGWGEVVACHPFHADHGL